MTSTHLALGLAIVALAGCDGMKREHKVPRVDAAAEEQAIRAKETGWMAAYNKRDANALAGQYAEDAAIANPGVPLATDVAARRAILNGVAGDAALKVDFASDRIIVAASGDLASSRGHYTMTYTDPGTKQPKTETGNYLTVYRKQADGSWQAVEDFLTPGPAAQ